MTGAILPLPMSSRVGSGKEPGPGQIRLVRAVIQRMQHEYGPQGWWPVVCERARFRDPADHRTLRGYHPEIYDLPKTRQGRWEVVVGAVLTQNTAWTNVERALGALGRSRLLTPESLLKQSLSHLGVIIRPAGYFNQKARYLQALALWFRREDRRVAVARHSRPTLDAVRPGLLAVLGVGPETADSILLYAYALPTFVVDAYTRRVLGRLGVIAPRAPYEQVRGLLEQCLAETDPVSTVRAWQQAHALFVEHAKRHHSKNAVVDQDFLLELVQPRADASRPTVTTKSATTLRTGRRRPRRRATEPGAPTAAS